MFTLPFTGTRRCALLPSLRSGSISRLAARDPLFATPAGRAAWESAARANLTAEFERWGGGIHYPMASA